MICLVPYFGNDHQGRINNFWSCILGNQGIAWIFKLKIELLTAFVNWNTSHKRKIIDSEIIDTATCKVFRNRFLDVEWAILIKYYYQTAKQQALYESTDTPAGQSPYNLLNSDGLGDFHWTTPKCIVPVYWWPWLLIWRWFSYNLDLNPKQRSGPISKLRPPSAPRSHTYLTLSSINSMSFTVTRIFQYMKFS